MFSVRLSKRFFRETSELKIENLENSSGCITEIRHKGRMKSGNYSRIMGGS